MLGVGLAAAQARCGVGLMTGRAPLSLRVDDAVVQTTVDYLA